MALSTLKVCWKNFRYNVSRLTGLMVVLSDRKEKIVKQLSQNQEKFFLGMKDFMLPDVISNKVKVLMKKQRKRKKKR